MQEARMLDEYLIEEMIREFEVAKKRCILLDYDGTLAPFEKLPSLAIPGDEMLNLLVKLSLEAKNEVIVISGRDSDSLQKWMRHLPLTLVAEHGAVIKYKNDSWEQQVSQSNKWKEEVRPLLQSFVIRCAESFIEEKQNTLAWHYRNANLDIGFVRSRELHKSLLQLTNNTELQVIDGNHVIEVRFTDVDKGVTASKIVERYSPDFIFCLGDDTTDEDMFRILKDKGYTVKVGSGDTAAQYSLNSQTDVLPLLRKFLEPGVRET